MVFILLFVNVFAVAVVNGDQTFWSALNQSVHNRLHVGTPLALACFSIYNGQIVERDAVACSLVQQNYTSSTFRTQFCGGYMNSQDEICSSNQTDRCLLDNVNPLDSIAYDNATCYQGSVSPYYIDIQEPDDVIQALKFSRETGIRLVIKNSGHDYLGRSSLKGSLALWVRNLRDLWRDPTFVPDGCSNVNISIYDTITVQAGTSFDEVYTFANAQNVTFIGAYASTVSVSGGWLQAGGHSVLSPVHGLGVDRVVQFKVVTPDGVLRTANSCQNIDLFWALRGGGGGTFGVVLESTHRVEKQLRLSVVSINFPPTSSNLLSFLEILVNNSVTWAEQGWGGHLGPHNLINVTPLLSLSEAKESFKRVSDYAVGENGTALFESLDWYAFYQKYVIPNQAPVGQGRILSSRLIPATLFSTSHGRAQIMTFITYILSAGLSPYIPVVAPYLYPYPENSTSASPAWRNSLWELSSGVTWTWNSTVEEKRVMVELANNLTQMGESIAPDSGTYMNEANPWTQDWQRAFWGENYPRLLSIKRKYDPEGLLDCWKCVGFVEDRGGTDGRFGCLEGLA
ncbi:hypothetical protein MMC14_005568 [Varicellaria rhodocarpa]|nr:hypothetical protein [Varicellaria rhodocarpa]